MTKETYFKLKEELKKRAKYLKKIKSEFRNFQSKGEELRKQYKAAEDRTCTSKSLPGDLEIIKNYKSYAGIGECDILREKRDYRYRHIVYCLARGRIYEQIEPKVREGNEVSWPRVEDLKKQYNFDVVEEVKEMEPA